MGSEEIFFEQIRSAGCLSYLLGCAKEKVCVVIDPEIDKAEDYVGLAEFFKSKLIYSIDTHTHADHNSACKCRGKFRKPWNGTAHRFRARSEAWAKGYEQLPVVSFRLPVIRSVFSDISSRSR